MRLIVFIFVLFCGGMNLWALSQHQGVVAAIYNVGALVIASILACSVDRR